MDIIIIGILFVAALAFIIKTKKSSCNQNGCGVGSCSKCPKHLS